MSILDGVALFAAVLVLVAYWRGGRVFDLANAVLWPVIVWSAVVQAAWASAALSGAFGVVGVLHLWRSRVRGVNVGLSRAVNTEFNSILAEVSDGVLYYDPAYGAPIRDQKRRVR